MNALKLTDAIIRFCAENGNPISNLQLQKILYFVQLKSYQENDFRDPIMPDAVFEAWKFGPVVKEVYDEYSLYGGLPITLGSKSEACKNHIPEYLRGFLEQASTMPVWMLVEKSHAPGGAWAKAFEKCYKCVISQSDMKKEAMTFSLT